uniref:Uncharacterized protein TCIL3000_11_16700 n=1 Tax=Trypanosoma congolense (strain IL3000) TaxID=1068625 RepID=G0V3D3_TRYCI|nr:unnamed protein product [Trypanosoma congolense IL3000]
MVRCCSWHWFQMVVRFCTTLRFVHIFSFSFSFFLSLLTFFLYAFLMFCLFWDVALLFVHQNGPLPPAATLLQNIPFHLILYFCSSHHYTEAIPFHFFFFLFALLEIFSLLFVVSEHCCHSHTFPPFLHILPAFNFFFFLVNFFFFSGRIYIRRHSCLRDGTRGRGVVKTYKVSFSFCFLFLLCLFPHLLVY